MLIGLGEIGEALTVLGALGATDIARITTGVKLSLTKLVSFSASFDTDLYKTPSYIGWIGLRANW